LDNPGTETLQENLPGKDPSLLQDRKKSGHRVGFAFIYDQRNYFGGVLSTLRALRLELITLAV